MEKNISEEGGSSSICNANCCVNYEDGTNNLLSKYMADFHTLILEVPASVEILKGKEKSIESGRFYGK